MPDLFGINIAQVVSGALKGQLHAGTFTRKVQSVVKSYSFEGVLVSGEVALNVQALSKSTKLQFLIIAQSITPYTTPRIQDKILFQNKVYSIICGSGFC